MWGIGGEGKTGGVSRPTTSGRTQGERYLEMVQSKSKSCMFVQSKARDIDNVIQLT